MGCDIHFYVELLRDGRWTFHDWEAPYRTGYYSDRSSRLDYHQLWEDPLSVGRNYDLFAILADVRNGRGFAGIETGDRFVPIAPPRDLPGDVSPEVLAKYCVRVDKDHDPEMLERWVKQGLSRRIDAVTVTDPDAHSASYYTLAELQAYDWKRCNRHQGWVSPAQFQIFQQKGKPESWCGGVSGGRVRHISNAEMAEHIAKHEPKPEFQESVYTLVEWLESYADSTRCFQERTIPRLEELAAGNPSSVRIVFWFDN